MDQDIVLWVGLTYVFIGALSVMLLPTPRSERKTSELFSIFGAIIAWPAVVLFYFLAKNKADW